MFFMLCTCLMRLWPVHGLHFHCDQWQPVVCEQPLRSSESGGSSDSTSGEQSGTPQDCLRKQNKQCTMNNYIANIKMCCLQATCLYPWIRPFVSGLSGDLDLILALTECEKKEIPFSANVFVAVGQDLGHRDHILFAIHLLSICVHHKCGGEGISISKLKAEKKINYIHLFIHKCIFTVKYCR